MFEYWIDTDTNRLPSVKTLPGRVFELDEDAYKLGVNVFDEGDALTLSGDIEGWIIKGDGTSMVIEGDKSGNHAWAILPEEACNVLGKISIFIKLLTGNDVITLGGFESVVYQSQTDIII